MTIVVLGPGGVGGLLGAALERSGEPLAVVARESTAALIAERGLRVQSQTLGSFTAWPRAETAWGEPIEALLVATKASGLTAALERVEVEPELVVPLLNGLDHLGALRARFRPETVVASTIRVEASRPEPGLVLHTSPFLRIEMASACSSAITPMKALAAKLEGAGVTAQVREPASEPSEAHVMWSKLARIAPLACMTSAHDATLGEIRAQPRLWRELLDAIEESCAVALAEGADIDPAGPTRELEQAHQSLRSSMQRDLAAGRPPELDAISGALLRAARRHGLSCPTIERLTETIALRAAGARAAGARAAGARAVVSRAAGARAAGARAAGAAGASLERTGEESSDPTAYSAFPGT